VTILDATSGTLTLASPAVSDSGVHDCIATNACGSATSAAATLTVTPLLAVAIQPVDESVGVDSAVSFIVDVQHLDGCDSELTYQWEKRDPQVADPDAADAWIALVNDSRFLLTRTNGLIIAHPIPALATGYRCRIGGGCGCRPASGFIHTDTVNFTIACPADFNADGGIDFGDVEAFFTRWENGC